MNDLRVLMGLSKRREIPWRRIAKGTAIAAVVALVSLAIFLVWASRSRDDPNRSRFPIVHDHDAEKTVRTSAEHLSIMSWNIAYGRGPTSDHGDLRDRSTVLGYLSKVAEVVERSEVDVLVLQEVDIDSGRSHHIDELEYVRAKLGWPWSAHISVWRVNYVPWPSWWYPPDQYGEIHMVQAVISKYPIVANRRFRLPKPTSNNSAVNAFFIQRAVQHVTLDVRGKEVELFNVHLEAFDQETRHIQANLLVEHVRKVSGPKGTKRAVVLGDLNAPPASAARKSGFWDEPEADFRSDKTVAMIREGLPGLRDALNGKQQKEEDTWTFPAQRPTRRLDYIFHGEEFELAESMVYYPAGATSDHVPVVARLALRPTSTSTPAGKMSPGANEEKPGGDLQ